MFDKSYVDDVFQGISAANSVGDIHFNPHLLQILAFLTALIHKDQRMIMF